MNKKKRSNSFSFFNAGDRDRTGTGITTHGILSPGRLPVPPKQVFIYISWDLYNNLLMGLYIIKLYTNIIFSGGYKTI